MLVAVYVRHNKLGYPLLGCYWGAHFPPGFFAWDVECKFDYIGYHIG